MLSKFALAAACVVLLAASILPAADPSPVRVPTAEEALATLAKGHPRLVLTEARLAELKKLAETDKLLAKAVQDVIKEADALSRRPPIVYEKVGPRLLNVSRECVRRVYTMGLAWRWTGKRAYADKALENVLAACDFKDWNPSHFLDTAEMSHAVGVGYDWLYGLLDEPTRKRIVEGLIKLGMEPGLKAYASKGGWKAGAFNWNQVCNGGLAAGALAIAEERPEYARRIIPAAVESLPKALVTYAPDGAWPEGPGYWGYATRYTVYGLAAMETALGTDFGLSKVPGLDQAGYFPIYTTGPTGYYFNFADVGGRSRRGNLAELLWLARRYDAPFLAAAEREMMARRGATPTDVIWYVPPGGKQPPKADLARLFRGSVEVAVFRSAWDDPDALYAAIKAGYNQVNHGHLDLGAFELDALGVRWTRELGSDDYNLPSYWGMSADAQRWRYYRLGSLSHNIPLLSDANQDVKAVAKVAKFKADGRNGFAVIDLGTAYQGRADKAMRGLRMVDGRAVLVQDELVIAQPCLAAWGITTEAAVEAKGDQAVLTAEGKQLVARVLSPEGATFTVESAERKPPEATNKGFRRLMVRTSAGRGPLRFAVLLSPCWPAGQELASAKVVPLAEWE